MRELLGLRDTWVAGLDQTDEWTQSKGLRALEKLVEESDMSFGSADATQEKENFARNLLRGIADQWGKRVSRASAGNPRDEEVIYLCKSWRFIGEMSGSHDLPGLPKQARDCIRLLAQVRLRSNEECLHVLRLTRDCLALLNQVRDVFRGPLVDVRHVHEEFGDVPCGALLLLRALLYLLDPPSAQR